jgi:putative peptidoglycan lipid II flippase
VKVLEAKWVLMGFLAGLFFFSLNKIILNVYYALHDTYTPMMISIVAMLANFVLNKFLVGYWQATGLAVATSISGLIQVVLFIYFLRSQYGFDFHLAPFKHFLPRFIAQTATLFALFMTTFVLCKWFILGYLADFSFWSVPMPVFLLEKLGLWLWVGPLSLLLVLGFLKTRRHFGIELYFID